MTFSARARSFLVAVLPALFGSAALADAALEVHPKNPRWLTDDGGQTALVLSGAHAWHVIQDYDFSPVFDASGYLESLARRGHNFTRGWFWEDAFYSPLPYARVDGLYRLTPPHDPAFVKRLRQRIREARRNDLYISVMLFQGWSMDDQGGRRDPDPWPHNPYNRANTNESVSKQQAALHIGMAQRQQLDYVSHLAEKLCSEPNIIWEIANEAHAESLGNEGASNWQRNILVHLRSKCGQRLTWASCPAVVGQDADRRAGFNEKMLGMPVDLVAPCRVDGSVVDNPPAADGRKVLIADTDHYGPDDITYEWVWKTFLRGQHPLFMDVTQNLDWWAGDPWDPDDKRWIKVHRALGAVQELVASVNKARSGRAQSGLAEMAPQRKAGGGTGDRTRPSSSPWALFSSNKPCKPKPAGGCGKARANGDELLVYAGPSESVRICQLGARENYRSRWKNSRRAGYAAPAAVLTSNKSGCLELENPSDSTAILHLERVTEKVAAAG